MSKNFDRNDKNASNVRKNGQSGDYYIGLDMGTDSLGWAATDLEYRLLTDVGRPLWGTYLFDEAKTAEERRKYRTARRRTARVRERILLLQSLFADAVSKVDKTFFLRLNDSKLLPDDKDPRITTKYILFGDTGYNDKQYFSQYPTIFHLRKSLTERPPEDIRLLYLACHHIIKNRGHFLFEGQNFEIGSSDTLRVSLSQINNWFSQFDDDGVGSVFDLTDDSIAAVSEILTSDVTKSDKQKAITDKLNVDKKDKRAVAAVKLISGGTCKANDLYGTDDDDDVKIDMSALDDDKFMQIKSRYDDDFLLDGIKAIYDWSKLVGIIGEAEGISEARVRLYDMHRADLALLKKYVQTACPEKKKDIFRHKKDTANYAAYIGMDKHKSYGKASKADFYAFLEKNVFIGGREGFKAFIDGEIAAGETSPYLNSAYRRYECGEFLPKQITSDNGVIPYQLHLKELQAILNNAERAFPFLSRKDDTGLTVSQKIIKLMTFRIPYYVGPLGGGKFSWAVRKAGTDKVKILPWNFDDVVDKDASEDKFIERMTCKCTYIPTEDVLPSASILYSEAVFLNELNNLRINGVKDARAIDLVYDYARSHKKVTQSAILNVLKHNGYDMSDITKQSLSGIDGDMKTSMSAYIAFKNILGGRVDTEREMCEEIIKWITLSSDKSRLERRIRMRYGDRLSDGEIKSIKGLNFNGWGRLSKLLLEGITSVKSVGISGSARNVIDTMREEKINLSEALTAERWGFAAAVEEYNGGFDEKPSIDSLYCSPSVKRAIRRTVAVVSELVKIVGNRPRKIMLETARGELKEQKGERTVSRKQQLLTLYKKSVDADIRDFSKEIGNIDDDRRLSSKRLFLYYLQNGKCMYTGEPIDLARLNDRNVYDIDHIYPRAKLNDDSLDNIVLVKRTVNAGKKDIYPLSADIRNKMSDFWRKLLNIGLLSKRKYERLVRKTPLTQSELAEFENRQLVMVRQSTKAVAAVLKAMYPQTEVVYTKAQKAAEFRNRFDEYAESAHAPESMRRRLIKVRCANNLHHAKDAYVNIVVGNVLNTEYGHDATVFYKNKAVEEMRSDYSLFRNGVKNAWVPSRDIPTVFNTFYNDNVRIVRFVSEGSGKLFDATVKTAGANKNLIPLKGKGKIADTSKYGGYDGASTAYFVLVKSKDKKGGARLSLEAVPVLIEKYAAVNKNSVSEYIEQKCGLIEPQIVIDKIRRNALLSVNGSLAYIRGKSQNNILLCNAAEPYYDRDTAFYLKKVSAFVEKYKEAKRFKRDIYADEEFDGITRDGNMRVYSVFVQKLENKMYAGISMGKQAENLKALRASFDSFTAEVQCSVIMKIVEFLNCNSVLLDLSDFTDASGKRLGATYGKNSMNKFIENKRVKLITQSPTGHYKHTVDLDSLLK